MNLFAKKEYMNVENKFTDTKQGRGGALLSMRRQLQTKISLHSAYFISASPLPSFLSSLLIEQMSELRKSPGMQHKEKNRGKKKIKLVGNRTRNASITWS